MDKVKSFLKSFLKFFVKATPTLTTAAIAAETLSGNPELIPLTQGAGAAAEALSTGLDKATDASQTTQTIDTVGR